jgi:hypothetical protein
MTEEYGHIPDGFFLSDNEVEELRNKKHELTEYGKQKLRELVDNDLIFYTKGKETSRIPSPTLGDLTLGTKAPETKLEIEKTMDKDTDK